MDNSVMGLVLHAIGGFCAGLFYLPIKKIQNWSWETGWILNGFFAWIAVPWFVAILTVPETLSIFAKAPLESFFWPYLFGVLWGIGSLTFGMSMRYLGMSLGMSVSLGLTAAFGTLLPPHL